MCCKNISSHLTKASNSSRGNQSSGSLVQIRPTSRSQFFRIHLWMSNLQEVTASSVMTFWKLIVRPSLKNLWQCSL